MNTIDLSRVASTVLGLPRRFVAMALRRPGCSLAVLGLLWLFWGRHHVMSYWVSLAVLMLSASVRIDVGACAAPSSLTDAVKFAWRATLIRLRWHRVMVQAKLVVLTRSGDSSGGAATREVPKLLRYGRARIVPTATGLSLTVDGSRIGAGPCAFGGDQARVLCAAWRARDVIATEHPRKPYLTQVDVIYRDPFAREIRPTDLPRSSAPGVVNVGFDSAGQLVAKDVRLASLLVGNLGSGKSSECWLVLRGLIEQGLPMLLWVADPKGGQEFGDMRGKAYRYEDNPVRLADFLGQLLAALKDRQDELREAGINKWVPGDPNLPLHLVVVDELVTFIIMMGALKVNIGGEELPAVKALAVFMSQMRAAGFSLIACSQVAQKEVIGFLRDLFAYKTCLRVGSEEMARIVLGDSKLYPAHRIPVGDAFAGVGYMDSGAGPVKYRSAYVGDTERNEICDQVELLTNRYGKVSV